MAKGRKRAFVLGTVMLLMVILIFLAASLFRLVPAELQWAARLRQDTEAYYAATAAVKLSLRWMQEVTDQRKPLGGTFTPKFDPFGATSGQPFARVQMNGLSGNFRPGALPRPLQPPTDPEPGGDSTFFPDNMPALRLNSAFLKLPNSWTADLWILPDKFTPPFPGAKGDRPPCYTLVALPYQDYNDNGQSDLGERYVMQVEISVVQGTFARYSYFVDTWPDLGSAQTANLRLPKGLTRPIFGGPVHTNDVPVLRIDSPNPLEYWDDTTANVAPSFASELSYARTNSVPLSSTYDGIGWYGGNVFGTSLDQRPYNNADPVEPSERRYERVFSSGQDAIRFVDRIDLPVDSDRVAMAAFGTTDASAVPDARNSEVYVYANKDAGVVVDGPVKQCLLDVLNAAGQSQCRPSSDSPVPTTGNQVVKLVHDTKIIYAYDTATLTYYEEGAVETKNYDGVTPSTLTYFTVSPGQADGIVRGDDAVTATVSVTSAVTRVAVPTNGGGGGSGGGGAAGTSGSISTSISTQSVVEVTSTETHIKANTATLDAANPALTITNYTQVGTETRLLTDTYSPTDVIIEAVDSDVSIDGDYLKGAGSVAFSDPPAVLKEDNSSADFEVVVPQGKTAVLRQLRTEPFFFKRELQDGKLNGAFIVRGRLGGSTTGIDRDDPTETMIGGLGLSGWVKGAKTFQARTGGENQDIVISGALRQFKLPQGKLPPDFDNALGLIGANIRLNARPSNHVAAPPAPGLPGLYLYGALLAANGRIETMVPGTPSEFLVRDSSGLLTFPASVLGGGAPGDLEVIGSVVQQEIGALLDTDTTPFRGWSQKYQFDPFLAVGPPPAFPTEPTWQIQFARVDSL